MTITNCIVIPHDTSSGLYLPLTTMAKCCQPLPRSLLLLLAWNILMGFSSIFTIKLSFELLSSLYSELTIYFIVLFVLLPVVLPVVGWVGDSLLGRYRAIIAGFFLLTVAFLIYLSAIVMFNWAKIPATILLGVAQLMKIFGLGDI